MMNLTVSDNKPYNPKPNGFALIWAIALLILAIIAFAGSGCNAVKKSASKSSSDSTAESKVNKASTAVTDSVAVKSVVKKNRNTIQVKFLPVEKPQNPVPVITPDTSIDPKEKAAEYFAQVGKHRIVSNQPFQHIEIQDDGLDSSVDKTSKSSAVSATSDSTGKTEVRKKDSVKTKSAWRIPLWIYLCVIAAILIAIKRYKPSWLPF